MVSDFTANEIESIYRVMALRRDMRHFTPDPIDPNLLTRLLNAAHMGPSVGYMQPWRFIRITDHALRKSIHTLVEDERQRTAAALKARGEEFLKLKVEGIQECAELLVVTLTDQRQAHIFGRRTLPHMDMMSVACAIQNLWLASRAEGIGMGWVSLFAPEALATLLHLPETAEPLGILCLGHVKEFYSEPLLAQSGWASRKPLSEILFENYWQPSNNSNPKT